MQLTKNFKLEEFIESRFYDKESQEDVWADYEINHDDIHPNLIKLANNLQILRDEIQKPITINIAYRPIWWEHKQGRSGKSQHCLGNAADIVVKGMSPSKVADIIQKLIDLDRMEDGGLGRYNTFTHFDVRGYKARWDETN